MLCGQHAVARNPSHDRLARAAPQPANKFLLKGHLTRDYPA
jgi:hypothetical protein